MKSSTMLSLTKTTADLNPKNKVIGFSGSPRVNGNSDVLLKAIMSEISKEEMPSDYLNLTKIQFQGCIGCEKCRKDKICTGLTDGMSLMYEPIISSKGLVLVSPTHNYNITSWMKAFIDRMYCFYNFENNVPRSWSSQLANQGRKAVIVAICEQENKEDMGFTIEAMKSPLEALGYDVIGELSVFKVFSKGKVKNDLEAMEKAHELGRKLAQAIGQ
ncbi:MAG: flavodoxin family protein [Desulfotalea sp.]